ncbi:facilitated trehalose transporter Tret1-like [Achroia grisella]|uniref:facilitated trehalose transporter Tret1-like n=1 Tax=Achroia grisella TaxID=688607 RepID=UPI0027D29AD1|nr:facilitated trehalose transporter Tret1-like [Achroia grisella]
MSIKTYCSAPFLKQVWVAFGILMLTAGQGMVMGFTTILLPALQQPTSVIQVDIHRASHLVSCIALSSIIGLLLSSTLMDWCGRKMTYLLIILPGIVGWLFIYFAESFPVLLIGRILCGITPGNLSLTSFIIGEYTSPKYRGIFLILKTASVYIGITIIHISGSTLDWRLLAALTLIFYVVPFGMACFWPESPAWLASRQEFKKCEEAFIWLRGTDEKSMAELQEMIKLHKEQYILNRERLRSRTKNKVRLQKFTKGDFIKPSVVMLFAFLLLETSGKHYFPAYALQFIGEITENVPYTYYYTLCIDLVIVGSCILSCVLVRVFDRRSLLLTTGLAAVVILILASAHIFLTFNGTLTNRAWVSISLLFSYFALANLGCTTLPLVFMGEIFPTSHRAAGSVIVCFTMSVIFWGIMKVTPHLFLNIKVYGTLAVFGALITTCLLILYFILPETKDRTLEEIEYYFNNGCFRNEENVIDDVNIKMINSNY